MQENIAERLPNLEELCLMSDAGDDFTPRRPPVVLGFPRLRRLELLGLNLTELPGFPKTLEYLDISTTSVDVHQGMGGSHFKDLETLKTAICAFCRELTIGDLRILLMAAKPSLTRLELQYSHIDGQELKDLMNAGLCENLTFLSISGLVDVDDDVIDTIIDTMPKLETLESLNTKVGPLSLKNLADTDKLKLKSLGIGQHGARMDQDAMDYAQSRGIEVYSIGMARPPGRRPL